MALSLVAHHQQSTCGSEETIFEYHSVFFSSCSGAQRLTKLILYSQPSTRVLATLLKTTCVNRLLSDEAESEMLEGNAL